MRMQFYLSLLALLFFGCAVNPGSSTSTSDVMGSSNTSINETNIVANRNHSNVNARNDFDPKSLRVDIHENDKLISRCFFNEERLQEEILYNTETNSEEFVIRYFYKNDGRFERLEVSDGGSPDFNILFRQRAENFEVHREILRSNSIKLPIAAEIIAREVDDLANIFSAADGYDDFKRESKVSGNKKVIKFVGFNKRLDFKNSPIALVTDNDSILIKDYELVLDNSYPTKEFVKTDDGTLSKVYNYKDGRLTGIVYRFTDRNNQTNSLVKRFVYYESK